VNDFERNTPHYGAEPSDTPYQRARQAWDERIGTARVQAASWRLAFFATALLAIVMGVALVVVLRQSRVVPYIVEVSASGGVVGVAPAAIKYEPTDAQIRYFLANFVELIGSVPIDPVVAKKNWLTAYGFLTENGARQLNAYASGSDPLGRVGKERVEIRVRNSLRESDRSFQLTWNETVFDPNGTLLSRKERTGLFSVAVMTPRTEEEILHNPLGLYIDNFSISEGRPLS
jgi:type IV secretory pathway TrbF-like protein